MSERAFIGPGEISAAVPACLAACSLARLASDCFEPVFLRSADRIFVFLAPASICAAEEAITKAKETASSRRRKNFFACTSFQIRELNFPKRIQTCASLYFESAFLTMEGIFRVFLW